MAQAFDHQELKRRRLAAGVKPELAAVVVDRTKEAIVSYERGQSVPPMHILTALCDLYRCEVGGLFVDNPDIPTPSWEEAIETAMLKSRQEQGLPVEPPDSEVPDAVALLRRHAPVAGPAA